MTVDIVHVDITGQWGKRREHVGQQGQGQGFQRATL